MYKTRIGYAFAALALIAVLGFLIVMTRSVGFDANNEVVAALRQLKQIDAEWNVDVLRSKTGLNNSYDPVASPLPLIEALAVQLQRREQRATATAAGQLPKGDGSEGRADRDLQVAKRDLAQLLALSAGGRQRPD